MSVREWAIWAGAAALSLLIHLALFVDSGSKAGIEKAPPKTSTRVSFRSVAAPLTPPQDESQKEEIKQPVEEVVEAPAPPPKPKPKKNKKRAEKVRQVEPPKPTSPPEPVTTPTPSTKVAQKPAVPTEAVGSVDDPALLERAKHEYLRRLMAHIESHKHYPKVARRRGIQGEVAVKFTLLTGGEVAGVEAKQGHRSLNKAALDAVAAAQPMPSPPPQLPLPMSISFRMQFALR